MELRRLSMLLQMAVPDHDFLASVQIFQYIIEYI